MKKIVLLVLLLLTLSFGDAVAKKRDIVVKNGFSQEITFSQEKEGLVCFKILSPTRKVKEGKEVEGTIYKVDYTITSFEEEFSSEAGVPVLLDANTTYKIYFGTAENPVPENGRALIKYKTQSKNYSLKIM